MSDKEERDKRRKETLDDIRGIVREEIKSAFQDSVIPGDYERCSICGELKRIDKKCPYCEQARIEAEPPERDDVDTFLDGI